MRRGGGGQCGRMWAVRHQWQGLPHTALLLSPCRAILFCETGFKLQTSRLFHSGLPIPCFETYSSCLNAQVFFPLQKILVYLKHRQLAVRQRASLLSALWLSLGRHHLVRQTPQKLSCLKPLWRTCMCVHARASRAPPRVPSIATSLGLSFLRGPGISTYQGGFHTRTQPQPMWRVSCCLSAPSHASPAPLSRHSTAKIHLAN